MEGFRKVTRLKRDYYETLPSARLSASNTHYLHVFSAYGTLDLDCLVGVVVKASASRAEDPGFVSRLRRDFSGVESYQ